MKITEKQIFKLKLDQICRNGNITLIEEYKFISDRKFKADYFIPELNTLLEYEGLFSVKSRHTSVTGYSNDCEKYNLAQINGYIVLRYTALTLSQVEKDIEKILTLRYASG